MSLTSIDGHLDDSELLGLTDEDGEEWQLDQWSRHVESCSACAARLSVLRQRAARFSTLIAEVQLPAGFPIEPPAADELSIRRRRRSARIGSSAAWLRAAAVVLILFVPLLTIEPLRAAAQTWLSERWSELVTLFADEPAEAEPPLESDGGSTILFVPEAGDFVLNVAVAQAGGSIRVRAIPGDEGSFEVLGASTTTPLVVPGGIRLLNDAGAESSYDLAIPTRVQRLRIEIAGDLVAIIEPGSLSAPIEVGLGGS